MTEERLAESCKSCSRCGKSLPLVEFFADKRSSDGKRSECKVCYQTCINKYKKAHKAELTVKNRELRSRKRDIVLEQSRRLRKKHQGRRSQHCRDWRAENPEKAAAHQIVATARRRGTLKRPDRCEACQGEGRLEAHHEDYAHPLDVRWLCRFCHVRTYVDVVEVAN